MTHRMRWIARAAMGVVLSPVALGAQTSPATPPPTMEACYVPASGTIYRINTTQSPAAGAPSACLSVTHVRFTWNQQGPAGPSGPAGPQGAQGATGTATIPRNAWNAFQLDNVNGFASAGTLGSGTAIGSSSRGLVMFWYPKEGAFRAGIHRGEWDEQNLGTFSVAMGAYALASGLGSTAFGRHTEATAQSATALGEHTTASGTASTALGMYTQAKGSASIAAGYNTSSSGTYSVALGTEADARYSGSFVFGDASERYVRVAPDQTNQFIARATGGVVFQVSTDGRTGCYLTSNSGGWQCTSDRNQKTGFAPVDGETVLGSLRDMPITTWRYRSDTSRTTHLGPTAQDFRAAFSLGADSATIGAVDAQGISLAAAKALEARTRTLSEENIRLRAQLGSLAKRLALLETRSIASANPRNQSSAVIRRRASSTNDASSRSQSDQSTMNRR